jgi:hypothetical protein
LVAGIGAQEDSNSACTLLNTVENYWAGKNTDLAVIKSGPSARIEDVENTEIVFKDGIGYDSQELIRSVSRTGSMQLGRRLTAFSATGNPSPHPTTPVWVYDSGQTAVRLRCSMSDDIQAELERLRAENEALKKGGRGKLSMKVSEKGALSVYGMGRFPVTLYKEQWLRLLGMADDIKAFIEANNERLKAKE